MLNLQALDLGAAVSLALLLTIVYGVYLAYKHLTYPETDIPGSWVSHDVVTRSRWPGTSRLFLWLSPFVLSLSHEI